ncbi:BHLH domain-containing protein [[Candida] zeylanoides]
MDHDWSATFSPLDRGIFFNDLGDSLGPAAMTPSHPSAVTPTSAARTPGSARAAATPADTSRDAPAPAAATGTPGDSSGPRANFSAQDQFFLQQIENNLYDSGGSTPRPPSAGAGGSTPRVVEPSARRAAPAGSAAPTAPTASMAPSASTASTASTGSGHSGPGAVPGPAPDYSLDSLQFVLSNDLHYEGRALPQSGHSSAFPPGLPPPQTPSMLAKNRSAAGAPGRSRSVTSGALAASSFASPILPSQGDRSYNDQHYFHKQHAVPPSHVRPDAVFTPLVSPAVGPTDRSRHNSHSVSSASASAYMPPVQAAFEPLTSPALGAQPDKRRTVSSIYAPHEEHQPAKRKTPHGTPVLQAGKGGPGSGPASAHGSVSGPAFGFDRLPEASVSADGTPMLPPQGKKVGIKADGGGGGGGGGGGPATMMGFTMGRLAEQQSNGGSAATSRSSSKRSSKVLLPKSSSSETSPLLEGQDKHVPAKKASHKVAEQGRRNRMNVAIHELAAVIPKHYHDEVAIPSKATTVELASRYICDLLAELDKRKGCEPPGRH